MLRKQQPAVVLVLLLCPFISQAGDREDSESLVKAALLYKLTQFVTWPAVNNDGHLHGPDRILEFCVIDGDSAGDAFAALDGRTVGEQKVVVDRLSGDAGIDHCDCLYFPKSAEQRTVRSYLDKVSGLAVLTIGDTASFADNGGMIEITKIRRRLGFRVNATSTREAGIRIAAPLLQLAKVIEQ